MRGPRTLLLALVLSTVPIVAAVAGAQGTPTLTAENDEITWDGDRFAPGATPPLPAACTEVTCDTFTFELGVSNGFFEEDQGLEVSIRWPVEQDDFELYLHRDGEQVGSSTGSFSTAEGIFIEQAEPATYTAVVVPLTVEDSSYEGLAELEMSTDPAGEVLPDLVSKPPHDLHVVAPVFYGTGTPLEVAGQGPISCYPDETAESQATRCLRFSNTVVNEGHGPLEARFLTRGAALAPLDGSEQKMVQRIYHDDGSYHERQAGTYEFHEVHGHVHYEGFAQHWLKDAETGEVVRTGQKNGFCMEDVALPTWREDGNRGRSYSFPACNMPTEQDENGTWMVQGISVGWADIYTWDLPDQYIDVTGIEPGCYTLVTEADPGETFLETERTDNVAQTTFYLGKDHVDPTGC